MTRSLASIARRFVHECRRRAEIMRLRGDNDGALALEVLARDIEAGLVG